MPNTYTKVMIEEHKKAFDIQTRQEIFTQLSKSDMDMANDKLYKNKSKNFICSFKYLPYSEKFLKSLYLKTIEIR